jgi:hypothetical protein
MASKLDVPIFESLNSYILITTHENKPFRDEMQPKICNFEDLILVLLKVFHTSESYKNISPIWYLLMQNIIFLVNTN